MTFVQSSGLRREPDQQELVDHVNDRRSLLDEEHTGA
jgi:hypothetical protein